MFNFTQSIKFVFFLCTYIFYPVLLYFAIMFPVQKLDNRHFDYSSCSQLYVYSIIFLVLYVTDVFRYLFFVILSILSNNLYQKIGMSVFIVNALMFSYGVLLVYNVDNRCLSDYDIKNYLCVSGIGILLSTITYLYINFNQCFDSNKSELSLPLIY